MQKENCCVDSHKDMSFANEPKCAGKAYTGHFGGNSTHLSALSNTVAEGDTSACGLYCEGHRCPVIDGAEGCVPNNAHCKDAADSRAQGLSVFGNA